MVKAKYFRVLWLVVTALLGTGLMAWAVEEKTAEAAFPGKNGRIAYVSYDSYGYSQIYTISPSGRKAKQVTKDYANHYDPVYSPDGNTLAYTAYDDTGHSQIYTIPTSGGMPMQVTTDASDHYDPAYSPSGGEIAYDAYGEPSSSPSCCYRQIYTIPASGGTSTQVTNDAYTDHENPTYSPDGNTIAYDAYDDTSSSCCYSQIYTVPASRGVSTQMTTDSRDHFTPTYSPDGNRIAYSAYDYTTSRYQIYTIFTSGGTPVKVTNDFRNHTNPTYSPDDTKIAFASTSSNGAFNEVTNGSLPGQIYTMSSSGGNPTQVSRGNKSHNEPDWGVRLVTSHNKKHKR